MHLQLPHLMANRIPKGAIDFSYRKKIVDNTYDYLRRKTGKTERISTKKIHWEVFYKDESLAEFSTIKEAKAYIFEKENT